MAFLGKEYKFVKEENTEGLIESFDISQERKEKWKKSKSSKQITKNADGTYSLSSSSGPIVFKSGVEFEHKLPDLTAKMTITVNGNTVTQVFKYDGKTTNNVLEFTDTEAVETITSSNWDGVAKIYYKA